MLHVEDSIRRERPATSRIRAGARDIALSRPHPDRHSTDLKLAGCWADHVGMELSERQQRSSFGMKKDIAYLLIFVLVGALLSVRFDLFERFAEWGYTHEGSQVDELAIVAMFMVVGLGVFGWRRWRGALLEISSHGETLEDLNASEGAIRALLAASPDLI